MTLRFLDTNVVVYSVSRTPGEAQKRDAAADILLRSDNALSVQVLQEFYTNAVRPSGSVRATHEEARAIASGLRRFPVQLMTLAIFDAASAIRAMRRFSYDVPENCSRIMPYPSSLT